MQKISFFQKIKNIKSLGDLLRKIGNKINYLRSNGTFIINNFIVSTIHGKIEKSYDTFQISEDHVKKIKNALDEGKELKLSNNPSKGKVGNNLEEELYNYMNGEQTWFEIKKNPFFDNIIKEVSPSIRKFLKSPFTVVCLNAWKTKPNMKKYYDANGNQRGPNRLHSDGYPPGHIKCLIYLQPLDELYGMVQVMEKVFKSEKAGCALMFNSNIMHQSITGSTNYRYVLELTLMRTAIEVDMLKNYEGNPDDKWFSQAYKAYI